jgi:hypothetical protein
MPAHAEQEGASWIVWIENDDHRDKARELLTEFQANPDAEQFAEAEKTAKRIADLVCAQVARGEARNVEVIKDIRTSYSGDGFWVRVYAKG